MATGFSIHSHTLARDLTRHFDPDKERELNRVNGIVPVAWISGAILVGAGATLYWLGHTRDERKDGLALAPVFSGQLTGLVVSGPLP